MLIAFLAWILQVKKDTIRFMLGDPKEYRSRLAILVVTTVISSLLASLSPLLLKFSIDALSNQNEPVLQAIQSSFVLSALGLALLAISVGVIMNFINELLDAVKKYFLFHMEIRAENSLQDRLYKHIGRFDYSFLGGENNLRIIKQVQWEVRNMQGDMLSFITKFIEVPTTLLGFAIGIVLLDWRIIVALLGVTLVGFLFDAIKAQQWRRWGVIENREWVKVSNIEWNLTNYIYIFFANGWFRPLYSRFTSLRAGWQKLKWKQQQSDIILNLLAGTVSLLMRGLVEAYAAWLVVTGSISVGTFSVFRSYSGQVERLLGIVGEILQHSMSLGASAGRVEFLLEFKSRLDLRDLSPVKESEITSIRFEQLSYTYPANKDAELSYLTKMQRLLGMKEPEQGGWFARILYKIQTSFTSGWIKEGLEHEMKELEVMLSKKNIQGVHVLKGVTVEFTKGVVYGVVGENGAGKTTLMRLLKRTLEPTTGTIHIGKRALRTIEPENWRALISSIEQTPYLIDGLTVRDNILLNTTKSITDKEIQNLLQELGLDPAEVPLDALVGEDIRFSGGQSQLLELTRALIDPRPILIFDEGTNQLDAIKEIKAISLIEKYSKNSIVFFISHRVTTTNRTDIVVTLAEGCIEAVGTPEELRNAKKENLFKKFWKLQVG